MRTSGICPYCSLQDFNLVDGNLPSELIVKAIRQKDKSIFADYLVGIKYADYETDLEKQLAKKAEAQSKEIESLKAASPLAKSYF